MRRQEAVLRMNIKAIARSASTASFPRLIIFGAPLILGLLELGHPALMPGDNILATIVPISAWWTILHVLQVPLFALLGVAAFLLVRDLDGHAATISRCAIVVFIVIYPAFAAAVGIASGVLCRTSEGRDLEAALQSLFWGPVTGLMAIVGSASWLVAMFAAAWALRIQGAPALAIVSLALSGMLLAAGHFRPIGPLACLFFLIGAAMVELGVGKGKAPAVAP
jgi:hypothetical protein